MPTFSDLIAHYTKEILADVSVEKLLTVDMMQVNRDAITLAQSHYKKTN